MNLLVGEFGAEECDLTSKSEHDCANKNTNT